MKTVGQLLHGERNKKDISIEEISKATKIDSKYIKALEADRYDLLPSETFTKGFVRNLALYLGCNPDEFVAIFRRDYKNPSTRKASSFKRHSLTSFNFSFSPQLLPIILGVVVFLVYLLFQFRVILTPPSLTVNAPYTDAVLTSPVVIEGVTTTDSLVTINNDNVVKPDQNGFFQIHLNLPVGETTITIKATNRFSRSSTTTIPLTVISN
jgi:cytoskeletal protein RodZ